MFVSVIAGPTQQASTETQKKSLNTTTTVTLEIFRIKRSLGVDVLYAVVKGLSCNIAKKKKSNLLHPKKSPKGTRDFRHFYTLSSSFQIGF
jgi:hypothetical protein